MVRFPHEKKGGNILLCSIERFLEFIDDNDLIDFPLSGCKFTWSNNQLVPAMSKK